MQIVFYQKLSHKLKRIQTLSSGNVWVTLKNMKMGEKADTSWSLLPKCVKSWLINWKPFCLFSDWSIGRVQYPSPQNWRPQLHQSATALVPPRVMGRSPRPISTLQEVTSEDEDRDRQDVARATTPHFLSPQPAPRQRSFSCTQHALQRRPSAHQPEPNYVIVTDRTVNQPVERVVVSPPPAVQPEPQLVDSPNRPDPVVASSTNGEQKSRGERSTNPGDSTQTAL